MRFRPDSIQRLLLLFVCVFVPFTVLANIGRWLEFFMYRERALERFSPEMVRDRMLSTAFYGVLLLIVWGTWEYVEFCRRRGRASREK